MKKLKIFLLLSLLVCFGFVLSSEVHAQGNTPKIFEVGDVLPVTTQLRISWVDDITNLDTQSSIGTNNNLFTLVVRISIGSIIIDGTYIYSGTSNTFNDPYTNYDGNHAYIDIDTSTWDINKRTISIVDSGMDIFRWEDLTPVPSGYSITFEENGGSTVTDLTEQANLPNPLPIPTKENHIFLGWYYDNVFTNRAFPGDPLTDDVILYAKWGSGKPFEIDDELPAGYIQISWDFTGKPVVEDGTFAIASDGDLYIEIWEFGDIELYINYEEFYADTPSYTIITLTEPVTITDVDGTSDYNVYIGDALVWEVVSPEYLGGYDNVYDGEQLEIEEAYILPESKIGINLLFNNTGGPKSGSVTFTFGSYGQIVLTAFEDNLGARVASATINVQVLHQSWEVYMIDDTLANQSFGSTRGILFAAYLSDFSWATEEERTITDITIEGDLDIDVIFTRILTEEEIAYQEGYSAGYQAAREIFGWKDGDDWYNGIDAWNLGEKYTRELYGFYDSNTDEWLSVDEYVARYGSGNGTGPTGPTDFYNNFDKYFIPAMIITFGGAIVLTILKVFKGRE